MPVFFSPRLTALELYIILNVISGYLYLDRCSIYILNSIFIFTYWPEYLIKFIKEEFALFNMNRGSHCLAPWTLPRFDPKKPTVRQSQFHVFKWNLSYHRSLKVFHIFCTQFHIQIQTKRILEWIFINPTDFSLL